MIRMKRLHALGKLFFSVKYDPSRDLVKGISYTEICRAHRRGYCQVEGFSLYKQDFILNRIYIRRIVSPRSRFSARSWEMRRGTNTGKAANIDS